jgi:hypothetical protein
MRPKLAIVFIITLAAAFLPATVGVQAASSTHAPEIVLHLRPPMVTGAAIKLPYEIPYPGYIEFYLFDSQKKKIWQDFGVKEKGEHAQSLKMDKFEKGKTYHYEFWYKGKPYAGKFSV